MPIKVIELSCIEVNGIATEHSGEQRSFSASTRLVELIPVSSGESKALFKCDTKYINKLKTYLSTDLVD